MIGSPAGAAAERDAPLAIVCAYPDGILPNAWFRAYKRVKRALRNRGLNVDVALHPITALPSRLDVLIVPRALAGIAPRVAGSPERIVAAPETLAAEVDQLVDRLVAQSRLEYATPRARTTAVHVGFLPVTQRARSSE